MVFMKKKCFPHRYLLHRSKIVQGQMNIADMFEQTKQLTSYPTLSFQQAILCCLLEQQFSFNILCTLLLSCTIKGLFVYSKCILKCYVCYDDTVIIAIGSEKKLHMTQPNRKLSNFSVMDLSSNHAYQIRHSLSEEMIPESLFMFYFESRLRLSSQTLRKEVDSKLNEKQPIREKENSTVVIRLYKNTFGLGKYVLAFE